MAIKWTVMLCLMVLVMQSMEDGSGLFVCLFVWQMFNDRVVQLKPMINQSILVDFCDL